MAGPLLNFDPDREEAELREYLGDAFDRADLEGHQARLEEEFARSADEASFYRSSRGYLYDLTVFAMSGTKAPYLAELTRLVPPGSRVLDYGCGIGSDGLILLEAGYRVEFADFENPSAEYLRWRLRRRGFEAAVHDIDAGVPDGFAAAYAFDVIEHVDDPFGFVEALEGRADLVMVNLLEAEPDEIDLHHQLPVADLLRRAAGRRLRSYGIHHGRSHLVAYEPAASGRLRRTASRALVSGRRLRGRVERAR